MSATPKWSDFRLDLATDLGVPEFPVHTRGPLKGQRIEYAPSGLDEFARGFSYRDLNVDDLHDPVWVGDEE